MDISNGIRRPKRVNSWAIKLIQSYKKFTVLLSILLIFAVGAQAEPDNVSMATPLQNKAIASLALSNKQLTSTSLQKRQALVEQCQENETCQQMLELCQQIGGCFVLVPFCLSNLDVCEDIVVDLACEFEGDCEDFRECDEDDEECEDFRECDEDDEECEDFRECDEDDEECEDFRECDEDEEECEDFRECDEDDEECEDFHECDEDDEECEDFRECDEDEEENEQSCYEFDGNASSGYINPNPEANQAIINVEKDAANKASHFLHHATLGANYATITQVAAMGELAWLQEQFEQPTGYLFPYVDYLLNKAAEYEDENGELAEEILGSPVKFHMHAWWTQAMTSPDLVRQRVAMALSEIFVVSSNVEIIGESPFVISQYYDTLLQHSFGNFRDLLKAISLTPAMAIYLSHLNNAKADPTTGTFPDENYAREVMQLFSIGLFELNPDGSRKQDANGEDIPTYGQNEIREFAKIFTGLSMDIDGEGFGSVPCCNPDFYEHARDMKPLKMNDAYHSTGEKHLLNGFVVPAGQTGMQDIDAAINNLFNHPNVGPFIGKQLVQRLVKSNPSPAYISRVTAAFNGETTGVRGDMKAVIQAILLDEEARTVTTNQVLGQADGRLREPFLRLLRLSRSFNAMTPDRNFAGMGFDVLSLIKQYVFYAPSVFNFFQPSYAPNGDIKDAGLVAPEFQITNASTIVEIKNLVDMWVQTGRIDEPVGQLANEVVSFDAEIALAGDADALLDRLDTVMTYGTLSINTRNAIKTVIEAEDDNRRRVQKAVYLIAVSPDYAVAL